MQDSYKDHSINEQVEAEAYKKLDQEITDFANQITYNLKLLQPDRESVLNWIKRLASDAYLNQSPQVAVFGSLTTGLALESSDMDLAITDLKIEDRYAMIAEMQKLSNLMQDWECLESFKFIDTASIPVIKMVRNNSRLIWGIES